MMQKTFSVSIQIEADGDDFACRDANVDVDIPEGVTEEFLDGLAHQIAWVVQDKLKELLPEADTMVCA